MKSAMEPASDLKPVEERQPYAGRPAGEGVQRDAVGWLYVLVGLIVIGGAVYGGGVLFGPM